MMGSAAYLSQNAAHACDSQRELAVIQCAVQYALLAAITPVRITPSGGNTQWQVVGAPVGF